MKSLDRISKTFRLGLLNSHLKQSMGIHGQRCIGRGDRKPAGDRKHSDPENSEEIHRFTLKEFDLPTFLRLIEHI